jgi:hypothetical protein
MREMIAEERFDDLVDGTTRLFDGIVERHIDQLRDAFLKRARELYGRKSEQLSEAQMELLFDLFREQVERRPPPRPGLRDPERAPERARRRLRSHSGTLPARQAPSCGPARSGLHQPAPTRGATNRRCSLNPKQGCLKVVDRLRAESDEFASQVYRQSRRGG